MQNKILILENDLKLHEMAVSSIGTKRTLKFVKDSVQAYKELTSFSYSLLIIDDDLPDNKGISFCEQLRSDKKFLDLPIIFMNSNDDVNRKVLEFTAGADDSLSKQIHQSEFTARVESKIRRSIFQSTKTDFRISNFRIDLLGQKVYTYGQTEKEFSLTPIEFKLLVFFLKNEKLVVSRQNLMKAIWGNNSDISDSTLDTHISSLRKKLAATGHQLQTLVKKGYIFNTYLESI